MFQYQWTIKKKKEPKPVTYKKYLFEFEVSPPTQVPTQDKVSSDKMNLSYILN